MPIDKLINSLSDWGYTSNASGNLSSILRSYRKYE